MKKSLKMGRNRVTITPPLGIRLQGSISRDQPSWRTMDDLYARVMLLDDGYNRLLLISCDLIEFSRDFVSGLKEKIKKIYGIAEQWVLLSASHTHTGPPTISLGSLRPDSSYLDQLEKHILGAVLNITKQMCEVRISVGCGAVKDVGINRRLPTPRGIRQLPNPEGPVDTSLQVIRFDDTKDSQLLAAVVNFTTHPTTLGIQINQVSADYPGRMIRTVREIYGNQLEILFTQGACGDVKAAALDTNGNFKEGEEEDIERLGRLLGSAVINTLEHCHEVEDTRLTASLKSVDFQYRNLPDRQEIISLATHHRQEAEHWRNPAKSLQDVVDWEDKHINRVLMHQDMAQWAEEMLELEKSDLIEKTPKGDLQVCGIGKTVALVGVPGELFSEIGKNLKSSSPFIHTMICGYSNGTLGYIPSKQAIQDGGYEVEDAYKLYGFPSCFHEDTEDMLYKEIGKLLLQLSQEKENH